MAFELWPRFGWPRRPRRHDGGGDYRCMMLVLAAIFLVPIAGAIECYQCTGSSSFFQDCMIPTQRLLGRCREGIESCYVTYTPPGSGIEAVVRGCGSFVGITRLGANACERQPQVGLFSNAAKTTVCNCDSEDACNDNRVVEQLRDLDLSHLTRQPNRHLVPASDVRRDRQRERNAQRQGRRNGSLNASDPIDVDEKKKNVGDKGNDKAAPFQSVLWTILVVVLVVAVLVAIVLCLLRCCNIF